MSIKEVTFYLEDNKIKSHKIVRDDDVTEPISLPEICSFLLDHTNMMEIIQEYDDEQEKIMRRQKAENEYLYKRAIQMFLNEVFEQITPDIAMRLMLTQPLLSLMLRITQMDRNTFWGRFLINHIAIPFKPILMRLAFGKRNAEEMQKVLAEIENKYL